MESPKTFQSTCPKCGYPLYCGCANCKDKTPKGFKPYKCLPDDILACAKCGLTKHIDWWESVEIQQVLDWEGKQKEEVLNGAERL